MRSGSNWLFLCLTVNYDQTGYAWLSMYKKRQGGVWSDHGTDTEMGLQLEELILTRAREIRATSVSETK